MKLWFSKFLAETTEEGRNVFRVAFIMMGAVLFALPLSVYIAIQTGAWQIYVILVSVVALLIQSACSAALARQNRVNLALALMIGGLVVINPEIAALISGLGLVLSLTEVLFILIIAGQFLSGRPATRALVASLGSAVLTIAIDLFAPWERASYPLFQTTVPYIAAGTILAVGVFVFRKYRDYSIRAKLSIILGFFVSLMIILGAIGVRYVVNLASQFNDLYENNLKAAVQLANTESALWQLRYGFPQFIVLDEAARAQIVADEPKWYQIINENMDAYAAGSRTPEELETLRQWNDVFTKYVEARPRWFELYSAGKIEEAAEWRAQTTTPFGRDSVAALNQLIELQRTISDQKQAEVTASTTKSVIVLLSVASLAVMIGLGVGLFFARSLYGPINRLTEVSRQIAAGNLEARAVVESQDETGILAQTFNIMSERLGNNIRVLDARASELQAVAEISTKASTSRNEQEMLQTVVELTRSSFSLYHTHIFLLDDNNNKLALAAGAGEVGSQMVSEKRSIPLDHPNSLVSRAARTGQGAISNDITKEPDFLPNPLLPDTSSEMSIPIMVGDTVLGVFDVQADRVNRFTDEDVAIMTTLAQQIAVSLQNLRSYTEAQTRAEREALIASIGQKIQSATSVESVLQITAREIGQALKSKNTRVIVKG